MGGGEDGVGISITIIIYFNINTPNDDKIISNYYIQL